MIELFKAYPFGFVAFTVLCIEALGIVSLSALVLFEAAAKLLRALS